jgi:hypothetical protein
MNAFEWDDTNGRSKNMTFSMDNTFVSSNTNGNVIWVAKNIMDSTKHAMVEWEVTLMKLPGA